MVEDFRVKAGGHFRLSEIDPDLKPWKNKSKLKEEIEKNIEKICELQDRLYAERKQALLVVLQAIDAGGKDGTIRRVFGPVNPQGCLVTSFKAPTASELAHDFLWRIHQAAPPKGYIGVFNRSHYEDVLIVRVHDQIDRKECVRRYRHINDFERLLSESGTRVVKFFLYISKEEQKARFQERLDVPSKNWKFAKGDLEERKLWDRYMEQYSEVLGETSKESAPWYVVPANSNTCRDWIVSTVVRKTLEEMDPHYPAPEEGLDRIRVV